MKSRVIQDEPERPEGGPPPAPAPEAPDAPDAGPDAPDPPPPARVKLPAQRMRTQLTRALFVSSLILVLLIAAMVIGYAVR
jgi:hypothetical protein